MPTWSARVHLGSHSEEFGEIFGRVLNTLREPTGAGGVIGATPMMTGIICRFRVAIPLFGCTICGRRRARRILQARRGQREGSSLEGRDGRVGFSGTYRICLAAGIYRTGNSTKQASCADDSGHVIYRRGESE